MSLSLHYLTNGISLYIKYSGNIDTEMSASFSKTMTSPSERSLNDVELETKSISSGKKKVHAS